MRDSNLYKRGDIFQKPKAAPWRKKSPPGHSIFFHTGYEYLESTVSGVDGISEGALMKVTFCLLCGAYNAPSRAAKKNTTARKRTPPRAFSKAILEGRKKDKK